jgi:hypothetical protein
VEEFASKHRTLSYDYERLSTQQKESLEQTANAERELNTQKSKLS